MKLNETSLTPLYQQVIEDIKGSIEDGKYCAEEKIPSETELSEYYSVSRITIRRAVEELCMEGYLVKKQGKGTYVGRRKLRRKLVRLDEAMSFTQMCEHNGLIPSVKLVSMERVPARKDEIEFLGLEPNAELLAIQRVHYADGDPIEIENNFYPLPRFDFLESEAMTSSLFSLLENKYNIHVTNTKESRVEIARANSEQSELLQVPVGEPLFELKNYFVDDNGNPLFVGHQFDVGTRYALHM